jgi:7-carboxy-7-deazaguanine synthase
MSYLIKEIFWTLQGEGTHAGRPAVFVRFAKCNLWTGREEDRADAICKFCDTDFLHGTRYTLTELRHAIDGACNNDGSGIMVVLTGGEPGLQVDDALIQTLRAGNYFIAIETNGTRHLPDRIDWVCVSPKANTIPVVRYADELKLVYPQTGLTPELASALVEAPSKRLQPMDGPNLEANTAAAVDYCLRNPAWSLSVQTHKQIGVR